MQKYDYIILGTGPAGYLLAQKLAKTDKSLLAVEGGLFGGTCPNVGCEPKIFLSGAVHTVLASQQLVGRGIRQAAQLDWDQLMKTKKARFDSWPAETKAIYEKMCDVAVGYGKFTGPHTIMVKNTRAIRSSLRLVTDHTRSTFQVSNIPTIVPTSYRLPTVLITPFSSVVVTWESNWQPF